MKLILLHFALFLCLPSLLCAGDYLRTKKGDEYRNFAVLSYGPDYFILQEGFYNHKIALDDLKAEDRQKIEPFCRQAKAEIDRYNEELAKEVAREKMAQEDARKKEAELAEQRLKPVKITSRNGQKSYEVTVVLECEAGGLRMVHSGGLATVPYEELPENWLQLLAYKLANVKGLELATKAREDAWQAKVQTMRELQGAEQRRAIKVKVFGVFKDGMRGILLTSQRVEGKMLELPGREVWLRGKVKTKSGGTYMGIARPDGYYQNKAMNDLMAVWWVE